MDFCAFTASWINSSSRHRTDRRPDAAYQHQGRGDAVQLLAPGISATLRPFSGGQRRAQSVRRARSNDASAGRGHSATAYADISLGSFKSSKGGRGAAQAVRLPDVCCTENTLMAAPRLWNSGPRVALVRWRRARRAIGRGFSAWEPQYQFMPSEQHGCERNWFVVPLQSSMRMFFTITPPSVARQRGARHLPRGPRCMCLP